MILNICPHPVRIGSQGGTEPAAGFAFSSQNSNVYFDSSSRNTTISPAAVGVGGSPTARYGHGFFRVIIPCSCQ